MSPRRALFIHGAGAWGGQWAIWRRAFEAEGWQVRTPDLQPVAAGLAATRFDDYVAQTVDALASAPADAVIGASLGGLIALAAVERAGACGALVLVNPLPPKPWAAGIPPFVVNGDVVPWRSHGRFASTQRAMGGASYADQRLAFRQWRDESAAVLREAHAGMEVPAPAVPVLVLASDADRDVPPAVSAAFASGMSAALVEVPGGHIDPVMGPRAAEAAGLALAWLSARLAPR